MKKVLPIVAGFLAGAVTVFIVESIGHTIWPPPEGIDLSDPESLAILMESVPFGAMAFVVLGWILGALSGGFTAGRIAKDPGYLPSILVGALLMVVGIVTMFMIPHPAWMWIMGVMVPVPSAWFGGKMAGIEAKS